MSPRMSGVRFLFTGQRFQMVLNRGHKPVIFNVPHILVSPPSNIGHQLPQSPLWVIRTEFGNRGQEFCGTLVHGKTSLTVGVRVTSSLGSSSMISASIVSPGRSFAALVALVTPSLIRNWPLRPRTTCSGGIPCNESPCFAICRANFAGSAPCEWPGGRCNSPESTSINSGISYANEELAITTVIIRDSGWRRLLFRRFRCGLCRFSLRGRLLRRLSCFCGFLFWRLAFRWSRGGSGG